MKRIITVLAVMGLMAAMMAASAMPAFAAVKETETTECEFLTCSQTGTKVGGSGEKGGGSGGKSTYDRTIDWNRPASDSFSESSQGGGKGTGGGNCTATQDNITGKTTYDGHGIRCNQT